jgi:hypothetical protein
MDANGIDGLARSLAGSHSRRSLLKSFAAGLAVVAAGSIGLHDASAANSGKIVTDFYDAIEKHEWAKAYGYLGSSMQAAQSLADFTAGFHDTAWTEVHVFTIGSGATYSISVRIFAWLNDGTPQHFDGTYTAGHENGVLKILDASLHTGPTTGMLRLCRSSQLHASVTGDSATGHRYSKITVTNTGDPSLYSDGCTMVGMPGVLITNANGAHVIRGKRETGAALTSMPLNGGDSAVLQLDWTNWCGADIPDPIKATITLAGNSGHLTLNNPIGVPPCLGNPGSASHLSVRPWQPA